MTQAGTKTCRYGLVYYIAREFGGMDHKSALAQSKNCELHWDRFMEALNNDEEPCW